VEVAPVAKALIRRVRIPLPQLLEAILAKLDSIERTQYG
jgi:hypothetical protein